MYRALTDNPISSIKRQKDGTAEDEPPKSLGFQNAIGGEWRNSSRKNDEAGPKQK